VQPNGHANRQADRLPNRLIEEQVHFKYSKPFAAVVDRDERVREKKTRIVYRLS
jgi:hypothetical protein